MNDELPPIASARFPRVRVILHLSKSLRDWLHERARDDQAREGGQGRPSMSAIVEKMIRKGRE